MLSHFVLICFLLSLNGHSVFDICDGWITMRSYYNCTSDSSKLLYLTCIIQYNWICYMLYITSAGYLSWKLQMPLLILVFSQQVLICLSAFFLECILFQYILLFICSTFICAGKVKRRDWWMRQWEMQWNYTKVNKCAYEIPLLHIFRSWFTIFKGLLLANTK